MDDLAVRHYIEQVATMSDATAFKKLFTHYYARLKRFSFSIVKNEEEAEEVTSDVFVNIWRNRERLLEIQNIDSYFYVSARNLSIRRATRNKINPVLRIEGIDLPFATNQVNPEQVLLNKEMIKHIEAAIEALPPRCRVIYQLARQEGLKYKQIAAILDISVKTIDAQMAIAVKRITETLKYRVKVV